MLTQVSAGTWEPPANGISLDPYETVVAVLWCATRAMSLRSGLVNAVQLGRRRAGGRPDGLGWRQRELCRSRIDANEKPVAESDMSLGGPHA